MRFLTALALVPLLAPQTFSCPIVFRNRVAVRKAVVVEEVVKAVVAPVLVATPVVAIQTQLYGAAYVPPPAGYTSGAMPPAVASGNQEVLSGVDFQAAGSPGTRHPDAAR
jgi:hypothetical protein